jgi:endonuclease/exonuclease/phosphatase (EEP) superfamily protein YafD
MKESSRKSSQRGLLAASWLYLLLLISWFLLYLIFGDGSGLLGLANAISLYFFFPLPFVVLFSILSREKQLFWPILGTILIFTLLWGPLFIAKELADNSGPRLTVMSFNVLGRSGSHEPILDSILAEDADVLLLQEVTSSTASILSGRLAEAYPYQILQAGAQASGMGVLSRYPIESLDISIAGNWNGRPQVIGLDWMGQEITLVNFHTVSTGTVWPRWVRRTFERREEDLKSLADFAEQQSEVGPVIVAGDANATHLNEAYKFLADVLQDTWMETGSGIGHTFPGPVTDESSFARISLFRIPYWLVRIDYIFASAHWQSEASWLAEFNGGSDHRGILTDLVLVD